MVAVPRSGHGRPAVAAPAAGRSAYRRRRSGDPGLGRRWAWPSSPRSTAPDRRNCPAEPALAEFERLGDVAGELAARHVLCGLWMAAGGYDEARRHGEAALALATRTGRIRDMAVAQNNLTWHEIRFGEPARRPAPARRRWTGWPRQCGEERLRALARANLAEVARLDGRYAEAVRQGRRAARRWPSWATRDTTVGCSARWGWRWPRTAGSTRRRRCWPSCVPTRRPTRWRVRRERRADAPVDTSSPGTTGICALIEATLAVQRGDREWAAEWFAAAAQASTGARDLRDVAEALVGVVATADDPSVGPAPAGSWTGCASRVGSPCCPGSGRCSTRRAEGQRSGSGVAVGVWGVARAGLPPTEPSLVPTRATPPEPPFARTVSGGGYRCVLIRRL